MKELPSAIITCLLLVTSVCVIWFGTGQLILTVEPWIIWGLLLILNWTTACQNPIRYADGRKSQKKCFFGILPCYTFVPISMIITLGANLLILWKLTKSPMILLMFLLVCLMVSHINHTIVPNWTRIGFYVLLLWMIIFRCIHDVKHQRMSKLSAMFVILMSGMGLYNRLTYEPEHYGLSKKYE